jgi:hypothetical protein
LLTGFIVVFVAMLSLGVEASAGAAGVSVSAQSRSLQQAIGAYRAGAPLHAMSAFVRIARGNPNSALPVIWAGVAATAGGEFQAAETYFREGLHRPHTAFQDRVTKAWLRRLGVLRGNAPAPAGTPQAIATLARSSNPRLSWREAQQIGRYVFSAARSNGVDPWLLAAVVYVESRFNQASISDRGAAGLGQLMPETARAAGVNAMDPWGNLVGTARTLRANYREFHDWRLALAAYNAGNSTVRRFGRVPPYAETQWYVTAVWAVYNRIRPAG